MRATTGFEADGRTGRVRPVVLERRELRADDLAVQVEYCGVCHSDLHALRQHAGPDRLVPGHEFTGTVTATGTEVAGFAVGDRVAVGNIVDSCGGCPMCLAGQENYCRDFPTLTYGGIDRRDGTPTLGAYAGEYVVRDRFAYHLPEGLDPAGAAPLMCAGVTVWEPLRALGVGPGIRVAVAGLGGLGHLAVKLAVALGATTSVISRSAGKADDARRLGAVELVSVDDAVRDRYDVVVDTIAVPHDLAPYLRMTAMDGTLSQLGHLGTLGVEAMDLLIGRKKLSSGGSGGRPGTREMLDFCARTGLTADVEVLPSAKVNEALERLGRNDVRYRFVLDLSDVV